MSIIEIKKLAKTYSEPINKVIDYTLGPIFNPIEKITTAKAECYISNMKKQNEYGLTKKEFQAWKRECFFAEQRQKNMGGILKKAIPNIDTNEDKINSISPDWFINYREKASLISTEKLQNLWANILSEEVNNPGTVSLQTISTLSLIDTNIAQQLQQLFKYVVSIVNDLYLYYPNQPAPYIKDEHIFIDENNLLQLESLGIIKINAGWWSPKLYFKDEQPINIIYMDKKIIFFPKKPNKENDAVLDLGKLAITRIGKEIYQLNGQIFDKEIFDSIRYSLSKVKGSKVIY
jgi:hypothetical protein